MASPGELVEEVARILGLPVASVTVHDRNLVMAGERSKGGRGHSAAKVTALDAAHLLVALLASAQVKDSVHSLTRYRKSRALKASSRDHLYKGVGITELAALPEAHSFVDVLEALIMAAMAGSLAKIMRLGSTSKQDRVQAIVPSIEISALTPGTIADVRIAGTGSGTSCSVRYALPGPKTKVGGSKPSDKDWLAWEAMIKEHRKQGDLSQYRQISEATIVAIANVLMRSMEDQDHEQISSTTG